MFVTLKNLMRDCVPRRYQVPIKYYYNKVAFVLEPEMEILKYLVKRNDRVIDVGGNRGIYTYKFWTLGTKVEVFEPNEICASILSAWAAGKKNVNVHSVALSNRTGSAQLHVPVDKDGIEHDASGSIETGDFNSSADQNVHLAELDSFEFEDVKFIKIDVEGHESSVIEGAEKTIRTQKPTLLIEIEQRHISGSIDVEINKILGFGYDGYFHKDKVLVPVSEFDVLRDQNKENLRQSNGEYINNFVFVDSNAAIDLGKLLIDSR